MKNKKFGFTLIELLAVIIILAIVALIATPIILDVIEDTRISAGKSEANMILSGINNYCASEEMKYQLDNSYERICTSSMNADDIKEMVNLGNATIDELVYDGEKLTTLVITSNNHKFALCPSGTFAMDDEECDGEVVLSEDSIKMVTLNQFPELATNGNGCVTPTDNNYSYMGGCYIKGNPNNNYVWYSGFLWRIMGINADQSVRLITEEAIIAIPWGAENTAENWDNSYAKDWLNNYFYPRLKGNEIIKKEIWCSETTTDDTSERTTCTNNLSKEPAYVGLMTIDEYNLAGAWESYLYLYNTYTGGTQWTMTPYSSSDVCSIVARGSTYFKEVMDVRNLKAVINVNSDATITGGNGTLGATWSSEIGPFILNKDGNTEITGKLNEQATSGEYVMFAGKKYRVVDKDGDGNTKLILDGYYKENETIFEAKFGDDNVFSPTTGIGQKLNTDVLEWLVESSDTENRNKLVTDYTWYQNEFDLGDSYRLSLEENNPTRSINATVGLIRIGEMLANQSISIFTNGYTTSTDSSGENYWAMTPYTSSSLAWCVDYTGYAYSHSVSNTYGLRAVIVVTADVTITGGNGTWSNPYQI